MATTSKTTKTAAPKAAAKTETKEAPAPKAAAPAAPNFTNEITALNAEVSSLKGDIASLKTEIASLMRRSNQTQTGGDSESLRKDLREALKRMGARDHQVAGI